MQVNFELHQMGANREGLEEIPPETARPQRGIFIRTLYGWIGKKNPAVPGAANYTSLLSNDIKAYMFSFLPISDRYAALKSCRNWHHIITNAYPMMDGPSSELLLNACRGGLRFNCFEKQHEPYIFFVRYYVGAIIGPWFKWGKLEDWKKEICLAGKFKINNTISLSFKESASSQFHVIISREEVRPTRIIHDGENRALNESWLKFNSCKIEANTNFNPTHRQRAILFHMVRDIIALSQKFAIDPEVSKRNIRECIYKDVPDALMVWR